VSELRGSANRRVAHVSRSEVKAVESLRELSSMTSCQPIGGSSKQAELQICWQGVLNLPGVPRMTTRGLQGARDRKIMGV
jgi:hypothetical protein